MAAHLVCLRAAGEYTAAYRAWQEWEKHVGRKDRAPANAWKIEAHRKAGAAAVRQAMQHEEAAIAEVKRALRAAR